MSMKNIVLATDFSSNAHIAAICAGEITCRMGGRLIILHALPPMAKKRNETCLTVNEKTEEAAQKELDMLAKELHGRLGISVSRLLIPGFPEEEIPVLTESLMAKLVIMGAQGEHLQQDRTLGSVSKKLIGEKNLPVICIPPEGLLNLSNLLALIIHSQHQFCNPIGFGYLTEFCRRFNTEKVTTK